MQSDQQQKATVQNLVEEVSKKVWRRRLINSIGKDDKGVYAYLGYDKSAKRVRQRFRQGEAFAKIFKKLWNKAVEENDHTVSDSLTTEMALRSSLAVENLKDTPYDVLDAVDFFLKHGVPKNGRITVTEAVKVFAERKADKKTRTSQSEIGRRNHKANFQPLIDKFGSRLLIDISSDEVEKWFREREAQREKGTGSSWSPSTWNSYRRVLVGFWGELARRNYCSEALNPFQQLVTRDIRDGNIRIKIKLAPVVKEFFHFLEDKANTTRCDHREGMWRDIAANVLTWFCGLRTEEKDRTSWEDLNRDVTYAQQHNLADSTGWELSVYATEEKTTTSKILPVPENARKWLLLVEEKIGPLEGDIIDGDFFQRYKCRKREFKETTGNKILQNSHRHTFASHHYAFYGSEELTKRRMGHTEDSTTLFNHYLSVINFTTASPYYEIIPQEVENAEAKQKRLEPLLEEVKSLRARSNINKLCWTKNDGLQPVQKYSDQEYEMAAESIGHYVNIDGVLYREDLDFADDDDQKVAELLDKWNQLIESDDKSNPS